MVKRVVLKLILWKLQKVFLSAIYRNSRFQLLFPWLCLYRRSIMTNWLANVKFNNKGTRIALTGKKYVQNATCSKYNIFEGEQTVFKQRISFLSKKAFLQNTLGKFTDFWELKRLKRSHPGSRWCHNLSYSCSRSYHNWWIRVLQIQVYFLREQFWNSV